MALKRPAGLLLEFQPSLSPFASRPSVNIAGAKKSTTQEQDEAGAGTEVNKAHEGNLRIFLTVNLGRAIGGARVNLPSVRARSCSESQA